MSKMSKIHTSCLNKLTHENGKEAPKVSKYVIQGRCQQDQRVSQVRLTNYANELSGKWLEILRKPSCQKLVCEKSNFCNFQGISKTLKMHAACSLQNNVKDIKDIKTSHNRFLTDFIEFICFLFMTSKMCMNYNVDCNRKSLNCSKIWFKALIYFELQQTLN